MIRALLLAAVLSCACAAQTAASVSAAQFAKGAITEKVVCAAAPEHSFSLYLPSNYTPDREWPVLFAFDPAARGRVPVELYRKAAEKYGYIVVGSNTSRNGPVEIQRAASGAMWKDVHDRFPLDLKRRYTTGFSGGARVAGAIAFSCGCVPGVIAHGAGFPVSFPEPRADRLFDYFAIAGDVDFNYLDIARLVPKLEKAGQPYIFRVFEGPHTWGPEDVATESLEWIHLRAMQAGRQPKDEAFIREQAAKAKARAESLSDSRPLEALETYAAAVRDFAGLADTTELARQAAQLEKLTAVEQARRQRAADITKQEQLTREINALLQKISIPEQEDRAMTVGQATGAMMDLRRKTKAATGDEEKVFRRALSQVAGQAFEAAQQVEERGELPLAKVYIEILVNTFEDRAGPHFEMARLTAKMGDKKRSLRELEKAVELGFDQPALLERDDFAKVRNEAKFQQLVANLKSKTSAAVKP